MPFIIRSIVFLALTVPFYVHAQGFSLFFQTPAINQRIGSFISVDAGEYRDLAQLGQAMSILEDKNGKSLIPGKNEPVDVVVVVPKGAPRIYVEQFVLQARREMLKAFPTATLSIETSYLDTEKEEAEYEAEVAALKSEAPQSAEEEEFLTERLKKIESDSRNLKAWSMNWYQKSQNWLHNPANRTIAARVVGSIKGVIAAKVLISKYGLDVTSAALGLYNGAVTLMFGYYATEFSNWCTTHSFFLSKRFPWLEKMRPLKFLGINFRPIEFYNSTPEMKSFSVNIFRSLGLAYIARSLAYLTHRVNIKTGEAIENPNNVNFFIEGAGLTLAETLGDAGMDVGLRSLTQKGYLRYTSRSYLLWAISISDTVMHSYFRAGDTASAYVMLAINTTGKSAIYLASKLTPRKNKKIVIVAKDIQRDSQDFLHVARQNNLTEAVVLNPRSDLLLKLQNSGTSLSEVEKILNLKDVTTDDLAQIHQSIVSGDEPVKACAFWLRAHTE